jgi:immune inhibitor A
MVAKLPPIAIGAIPTTGMHLRAPRADVVERQLRKIGVIPNDATPDQLQAALDKYYQRFAKQSNDWVSPKIQEWARNREAQLATPGARALAIQPVTATVLAMAVEFTKTETLTLPMDDGTGNCVTQTVTITGPMKGHVPPPGPQDNFTIWYSPTLTSDAKFYEKLMFGYEGVGRARYDLTDPDDKLPGINLAHYTMQDYYDNVAGMGNVYITGTVVGWVPVPHSEGYYGAPNCATGGSDGGAGVPVGQLVVDALKVFSATNSSYYTDTSASAFWKKFDLNHDGVVDQFALVHAGADQAAGGGEEGEFAIWSHSSSLFASGYFDGFKVYEGDPSTTADDIYVFGYTMQPESLDLGVLVEEFGHNFFGWPDLYTTDYENSTGFWNEMAGGSWLGWLGGSAPAGMPLWFRMIAACGQDANGPIPCNWQEPMVTRSYTDTLADVTIGQLEKTPAGVNKGVRINMPSSSETINNEAGTGKGAYTDQGLDNANLNLERQLYIPSSVTGTLTISSSWYIEEGYDYGFVIVNDKTLKDTSGYMTPYGTEGWWGLTGLGSGVLTFDLSAYKGTTVTLRLNYRTDTGYTDPGWWVDDVKLDGQLIGDFETATAPHTFPGWTNSSPGWTVAPLTRTLEKYYLVEWRSKTKYDQMVKTAYQFVSIGEQGDQSQVERIPHNLPGALVYYRDQGYKGTYSLSPNFYDLPSIGPKYQLLIVDTHPEPMRWGVFGGTVWRLSRRAASYDAALTLQPTERITVTIPDTTYYPFTTTVVLPSKSAVTQFSDAKGYYAGFYAGSPCAAGRFCFANTESSVVVPARGIYSTKITHFDGTPYPELYGSTVRAGGNTFPLGTGNPGDANVQYGVNVELRSKAGDDAYNSTATLRFQNLVIKKDVGPAPANITAPGVYTFTYWIALTNQSAATVNGTITMTLPMGLNFVSATPASGSTMLPPGGTASVDRQFVWSGYSLPASTPITFTLVATTEVKTGDPLKTWVAYADVNDGVNPVTHDQWTTTASLFAAGVEAVGGAAKVGVPGGSVVHTVQIVNTGYTTDTFQVGAVTQPGVWFTAIVPGGIGMQEATAGPISIGPLGPDQRQDVMVFVYVPIDAMPGAKATTTVTAISEKDPTKTASLTLTTSTLFKLYLPVVIR